MKTAVVCTTINDPLFVREYLENFKKFEVKPEEVVMIVVGDNKTPPSAERIIKKFTSDIPYDVEYWSPERQNHWIRTTFSFDPKYIERFSIPQNDPRRRNMGFLRALELDVDQTIVIDDDNFPDPEHDWLRQHLLGLYSNEQINISSLSSIVNPCRFLYMDESFVYSRGYPVSKYFQDSDLLYKADEVKNTVLNMGLWKLKPDVDSFTNLIYPNLHCSGKKFEFSSFGVGECDYFPINTQNTSFKKELSIFHNVYMENGFIHRYDDIWGGLFAQKLANRLGDRTSFGIPLVEHRRNSHNYQKDLCTEYLGIATNSEMWEEIMGLDIQSKNYLDGFLEIADNLPIFENLEINTFLHTLCHSMRFWVKLLDELI